MVADDGGAAAAGAAVGYAASQSQPPATTPAGRLRQLVSRAPDLLVVLVRRAHEKGVRVVPLVGPSSLLLALMASGLNGQSFTFHGFRFRVLRRERNRITALRITALPREAELEEQRPRRAGTAF